MKHALPALKMIREGFDDMHEQMAPENTDRPEALSISLNDDMLCAAWDIQDPGYRGTVAIIGSLDTRQLCIGGSISGYCDMVNQFLSQLETLTGGKVKVTASFFNDWDKKHSYSWETPSDKRFILLEGASGISEEDYWTKEVLFLVEKASVTAPLVDALEAKLRIYH